MLLMKKILLTVIIANSSLMATDCILENISFKDGDGRVVNIRKACFDGKPFLIKGETIVQILGVECSCEKKDNR